MNPYFEQHILSADPIELVRLVYQRAITSVGEARNHLRRGRIAERSKAIGQAYAALHEMLGSLRPEVAPELVGQLRELYLYMQRRLLDANRRQADAPLTEVLGLLTTLAEAWNQLPERASSQEAKAAHGESDGWIGGNRMESGIALEA